MAVQQLVDNRYRIVEPLGSGGMAKVYLAHDEVLDRNVALKVLSERYANDEELIERFRREAKSAASLSHPNIVSIHDRGETKDGTYYIAMECLPGGTLKDRILRKGPLPPHAAAEVAIQIAEALEEAHRNGVIHRDIKPQNVLVTASGDVKVADFGIARAARFSRLTRTGYVLGTTRYMSPEQARGDPVDERSDLYSLGVVLYEMLTGELPRGAEIPSGKTTKHANGRLRYPREVNPDVPESMSAVTARLLAEDPADRYRSVAALIADLERERNGLPPEAATQPLKEATGPTRRGSVGRAAKTKPGRVPPALQADSENKVGGFRDRWNRRLRVFAATVAATLIAVVALLAALPLIGVSQQELAVPDLRGETLDEAKRITGTDFELTVDSRENNARPKDTVLSQDPAPNRQASRGSTISVVLSSGEETVAVPGTNPPPPPPRPKANEKSGGGIQTVDIPDVTGRDARGAVEALLQEGVSPHVVLEQSQEPPGTVLRTDPPAGSEVQPGTNVLVVSSLGFSASGN